MTAAVDVSTNRWGKLISKHSAGGSYCLIIQLGAAILLCPPSKFKFDFLMNRPLCEVEECFVNDYLQISRGAVGEFLGSE